MGAGQNFRCGTLEGEVGGGGVSMSHVEFKKCRSRLLLQIKWINPISPLRCTRVACPI